MITPSSIHPDTELRDFLQGLNIYVVAPSGETVPVAIYGDWEKPTNEVPDDFIIVMQNGDIGGVGNTVSYADGYIMVSLYCKLNDDGSVKKNRVNKILQQLDEMFIERIEEEQTGIVTEYYKSLVTDNYVYKYDAQRFITPTTPNITSGYSITNLNLRWHTNNDV